MRYLIDTHCLSNKLTNPSAKRDDLYIIDEVMDEYAFSEAESRKVTRAGIKLLSLQKKHIEKMAEILITHGANFKLIRLYTSEGVADVAMLAFILAERDAPETLFPDEYTLVTQDIELRRVAEEYGVVCLANL